MSADWKEKACQLSDDDWQAFTVQEAAKAIGQCLEARGRLDQPIKRLTMRDLERMADSAVSRWVVVNSYRLKVCPRPPPNLTWLLGA
jgi:hypothetical protein